MTSRFQVSTSVSARRALCERIRRKHPDHIPVILEPDAEHTPPLHKCQFLLQRDLTIGQLSYVIARQHLHLPPGTALFLLCGRGVLLAASHVVAHLHALYADAADGMLYLTYALENTFG